MSFVLIKLSFGLEPRLPCTLSNFVFYLLVLFIAITYGWWFMRHNADTRLNVGKLLTANGRMFRWSFKGKPQPGRVPAQTEKSWKKTKNK